MIVQLHQVSGVGNLFKFTLIRKSLTRIEKRFTFESIDCRATLKRSAEEVSLRGGFRVLLKVACDFCLVPTTLSLDRKFKLKLIVDQSFVSKPAGDFEVPLHGVDTESFNGREIDLATIFEDQLLLELPFSFRCKEGCKGICSSCGADLNQRGCECGTDKMENPFAILRQLKV